MVSISEASQRRDEEDGRQSKCAVFFLHLKRVLAAVVRVSCDMEGSRHLHRMVGKKEVIIFLL